MKKRERASISIAVALIVSACLLGCAAFGLKPETLRLYGARLPPGWRGLAIHGYLALWTGSDGSACEAFMSLEGFNEARYVEFPVPSAALPFIRVFPILQSGERLKPSAFMYPADFDEGKAGRFTYSSGYEAEVALALDKAGRKPWSYPVARLADAILDSGKDPWDMEPWRAAEALALGKFRIGSFPGKKIPVALPEGRQWWPSSPFASLVSEEGEREVRLAEGLTVFLSQDAELWAVCREGEVTTSLRPRVGLR